MQLGNNIQTLRKQKGLSQEKLAEKYKDKIVIYKVNTDKERELAAAFGITSLPTLVFIPLGDTPQVSQGALPQEVLEKGIEEVLLK